MCSQTYLLMRKAMSMNVPYVGPLERLAHVYDFDLGGPTALNNSYYKIPEHHSQHYGHASLLCSSYKPAKHCERFSGLP